MSVYKDNKRGTWFVSLNLKDKEGKRIHKYKRGFKTQREARQWERDNCSIAPIQSKYPTFLQVVHTWEAHMQASPGTIRQHSEHFRIRFAKYLEKPINEFDKPTLINWRIELSSGPWATKTKNTTIAYVKGLLKFAADLYNIPDCTSVLTKLKQTEKEVLQSVEEFDVWTPEEFNLFLANINEEPYKTFFMFLYWTGCRRGEAIALQKSDLSGGWVNIKYSQRDATTGLKPTKTRQSRKIELDNELWIKITALSQQTKGPYVFGGERGLSPTSIDRRFAEAKKRSGVKNIRLHDLRHSHASVLINAGVNIVAVSKRLGHSTIDQTLKTYTHLLESSDQNMMRKLNEMTVLSHGCRTPEEKAQDMGLSSRMAQEQGFDENTLLPSQPNKERL